MASTAYQLPLQQPERRAEPRVRVVKGGRRRLDTIKQALRVAYSALLCAILLGLVVSLVYSQSVITELNGKVDRARSDLAVAQSTFDYLSAQMDAITSHANISDVAEGSLGLVKADASQYTYLQMESESKIVRESSTAIKLFSGVRTAALNLLGSMEP